MFVLVREIEGNYGGSYEYTEELGSLEELARESLKYDGKNEFVTAYEIKREIKLSEMRQFLADREAARQQAIEAARAKLTTEELELLGIK